MMMTLPARGSIEVKNSINFIDYFQSSSSIDKPIESKPIEYHPVAKETYKEDNYVYNDDNEPKIDADIDWGDDKGDEDFEVVTNQYSKNNSNNYNTTPVDIYSMLPCLKIKIK